uniref:PWWP domain-containing protein n=2 Tax=Ornithodoros turicata TaxID=34597 RepID=A0A2R5LLP9_9ACAR
MANSVEDDANLFKGSKISVMVEEALIDVIIVSFHYGSKIFQGALLDVTKKNVPFGIRGVPEEVDDRFHALKQRHTYFQEKSDQVGRTWSKSRKPRRDQSVRMRRLRPRQVLCSHCRAICNENSENVQLANVKKAVVPVAVVSDAPETYASMAVENAELPTSAGSFLPKSEYQALAQPTSNRMILRKRKAEKTKTSPVIKISFANPQGKGTVVKIPAKLQSTSEDGRRKALKRARREHHRANHHKHKRKRKHRDEDEAPPPMEPSEPYVGQKLSISLRRLGSQAYMRCSPRDDSSGSECGDVPEFPKLDPARDGDRMKPLMMRISTHTVKRCTLETGREMAVGDIVWGKIHGFPWWPGKVLALTISQRDNGVTINQQAHVAWFGSSTSSYMPCHQLTPFLDDFKVRYNKKKRGPYKEAIRQATLEAQQVAATRGPSPT